MNVRTVLSASKEFLRTREAVDVLPSIIGLKRHVEAAMRLYEIFVPNGTGSCTARLAFNLWRLVLVMFSDTVLLRNKLCRL